MLWTLLIITSFSVGFWNISQTANDFYNYDVITNVERFTPNSITYPAITICVTYNYKRDLYKNGTLVKSENIYDNTLRIRNFLKVAAFNPGGSLSVPYVKNNVDFFQIKFNLVHDYDCLRINGATNKKAELIGTNNTLNKLHVHVRTSYIERVSDKEYFNYSLNNDLGSESINQFYVYFGDNYLDSFYQVQNYVLDLNNRHSIEIEARSIESKLGEPYNQCKESKPDEVYFQKNCIESCVYREIKKKYNCSFPGLFASASLKECELKDFPWEFTSGCEKECPVSCYSVQYIPHIFSTVIGYDYTEFQFSIPDFTSLKITQIPKMNGFSLLSEIGGSLGLFMGISFLNFIEIVEFIFDMFTVV